MPERLAYWTDEAVDARNAGLRLPEGQAELMLRETAGMDAREALAYERAFATPARERLMEAVLGDVRRRDAGELGGWEPMRDSSVPASPSLFSSFRLGHASLVGMIGCDYDGYADPRTGEGDPGGLMSLIKELAEMTAKAYANIPSRYWPLDCEDGCWVVRDVSSNAAAARGRVRVPLGCLCCDESDLAQEGERWSRANLMTAAWWARFESARAGEIEAGLLAPLPAAFPARMIGSDEDGAGMDGGVMLACAELLRRWEDARERVPGLAASGDVPALCSVIDMMLDALDRKVMLVGWSGDAATRGERGGE